VKTLVIGKGGTIGAVLERRLGAPAIEVRVPDARDEAPIEEAAGADAVVNAGGPRVRPGLDAADYFREHVGLATKLARSMRPGAHLVHLSSTAVYGARGKALVLEEPPAPTLFPSSAYASAKLAAENAARDVATARGVRLTVLRPSMVYGPGIDSALASIKRLSRRGIRLRFVPGSIRQHLTFVGLLGDAVARAIASPPPDARPRMFVVADPFVLTNAELVPPRGVPITIPLRAARSLHRLVRVLGREPPGALDALAVLAIDNVFDHAPLFDALDLDRTRYARARTFEPYWGASGASGEGDSEE
jgi:nucleoside-diphosphate-sugar epimerase